jgi:hypothetical protein
MRPRELPGTVLVRHADHILELVRISSRQSASGGVKRRVETTDPRRIPSEALRAHFPLDGGNGELIVCPAIIAQSAMMLRMSERRGSNRGGQN